jgi:hypothetical protein
MGYEFQFAREQAIAIASDRVGHLPREVKAALLDQIDRTLEQWKREQTQPDGTIVVEPPPGDFLWLDSNGEELSDQHERIPAADLRPEQCAGPFVRSKSDLFTKLSADNYAPLREITGNPDVGHDVVMALLVERDGNSMPAESLASALHYVWIYVWASREESRKMLSKNQAEKAKQLAEARVKSAKARIKSGQERDRQLSQLAVDFHTKDRSLTCEEVATKVHELVKDKKGFELHTVGGIGNRIRGFEEVARRRLRAQPK